MIQLTPKELQTVCRGVEDLEHELAKAGITLPVTYGPCIAILSRKSRECLTGLMSWIRERNQETNRLN